MVQLVSDKTGIKTTVFSNEAGRYEFPKLDAGTYVLQIARPMEFKPFKRDSVSINGSPQLEEIVLERVVPRTPRSTDSELLPPTPETEAQLSGSEWMMNLPATWEEKRRLNNTCGYGGCHTYTQILKNRFDEAGWRAILNRMLRIRPTGAATPMDKPFARGEGKEFEILAKFLARVRGPDSLPISYKVHPRPRGPATRVIFTEYELPHWYLIPHDPVGDPEGNIWYSSHRTNLIGKLNPRTGEVTEYKVPSTLAGAHPGTHWITWDDKRKVLWMTVVWAHQIAKFDPRTKEFSITQLPHYRPLNEPQTGNMGLHPDGSIWAAGEGFIRKFDPETGKELAKFKMDKIPSTYENAFSDDGRYWCGGGTPRDFVACLDIQTGEAFSIETPNPRANPARGGFAPDGTAWFGGRGGAFIKVDVKKRRITEYPVPTPFASFYEVKPDKNGEVWGGELHGGRFARFNPRTEQWIEYVMPIDNALNRRTWIDNSTNPVTVWYVDTNYGGMFRIQPLE